MNSIRTERLYLRPCLASDVDAMLPYHSDPDVVRYIPWPVRTREQVLASIEKGNEQTDFAQDGDYLSLAIVRQDDDQLVGQVNAMYRSNEHKHAEIGYVINPAFSGLGYAREAVAGLIDRLFAQGFHRITAHLDDRNAASQRLLERLGFRREAHMIDEEFFKGEWSSTYLYAILDREWQSSR